MSTYPGIYLYGRGDNMIPCGLYDKHPFIWILVEKTYQGCQLVLLLLRDFINAVIYYHQDIGESPLSICIYQEPDLGVLRFMVRKNLKGNKHDSNVF